MDETLEKRTTQEKLELIERLSPAAIMISSFPEEDDEFRRYRSFARGIPTLTRLMRRQRIHGWQ